MKLCILEDRGCIECGKCDTCDLNENKICDNCCECMPDADYNEIVIDSIENE